MSAPPIPVLVTRTLIALTMEVLSAALVNKDLLEMALFAKVCAVDISSKNKAKYTLSCVTNNGSSTTFRHR